jgi:hypothetical protein
VRLRIPVALVCTCSVFTLLPAAAYANSSWHWVTTSPMTVFPFAVIITLLIETFAVAKYGKVSNTKKSILVIGLANLLSFLAPYLERAYRFIPTSGGFSIFAAFNKGPYYMVLSGFLLLTVVIELPLIFFMLREYTSSKKSLFVSILLSNIATTVIVAGLERLICIGRW